MPGFLLTCDEPIVLAMPLLIWVSCLTSSVFLAGVVGG